MLFCAGRHFNGGMFDEAIDKRKTGQDRDRPDRKRKKIFVWADGSFVFGDTKADRVMRAFRMLRASCELHENRSRAIIAMPVDEGFSRLSRVCNVISTAIDGNPIAVY